MASCLTPRQKLDVDGVSVTATAGSSFILSALAAQFFAAVVRQTVLALSLTGALGLAWFVLNASQCGLGFSGHQSSVRGLIAIRQ